MKYLACIFIFLGFVQCGEKVDPTIEIYSQAKTLEKQGKIREALLIYDKLKEYDESETYIKAKNELLAKGYSLGSSLDSWTIKELVKIENLLLAYNKKYNCLPSADSLETYYDGWYNEIEIILLPNNKHLFKLLSNGADSLKGTDDDILLAYRNNNPVKQTIQTESRISLQDLAKLKKTSQTDDELKRTLSKLEKFSKDTSSYHEKQMNLNQLMKKKKK